MAVRLYCLAAMSIDRWRLLTDPLVWHIAMPSGGRIRPTEGRDPWLARRVAGCLWWIDTPFGRLRMKARKPRLMSEPRIVVR